MTYEDSVIQLCSDYAALSHVDQFRKDKITPYFSHPARVALYASSRGKLNFLGIAAAFLHDVLEDCAKGKVGDKNYPFIIKNHKDRHKDIRLFLLDNPLIKREDGKRILELTVALTMSQDKSISKKERKEVYLNALSSGDIDACIIKYCDRIDNLTTVHHFSQGGFKWYISDTEILINKLSDKVKCVNYSIHLDLERKLEEVKKTYQKLYQ